MSRGFLRVKPDKTVETTPTLVAEVLASYLHLARRSWWQQAWGNKHATLSLEIVSYEQKTHFFVTTREEDTSYFESQLAGHWPSAGLMREKDPLVYLSQAPTYKAGLLTLVKPYAFPLKTYEKSEDGWLPAGIVGFMGKLAEGEVAVVQIVLSSAHEETLTRRVRGNMRYTDTEGSEHTSEFQSLFQNKLAAPFLEAQIRLLVGGVSDTVCEERLKELAGTFGVFTLAEGNSLLIKRVGRLRERALVRAVLGRNILPGVGTLPLNLKEIASMWQLPGKAQEALKGIDWGKTVVSEPPDNLPVVELFTDESAKREVNFFGKVEWRNRETVFGMKREDRGKHTYIIGKTGAGKSTLIANMMINDIRNGEGVAVIDPHGDLSEMILEFIPKRRMNDVIYLDPTLDDVRQFSLNLFDDAGAAHTDVVASGIVSVFHKLYYYSWGPRLEYILRNCVLTLLYYEDATFADIPRLLTDRSFRAKVVAKIRTRDEVLGHFWTDEYEKMNDKLRTEAIAPVLNKVGQFLSSQRIRQVVSNKKSTFSLEEVMNNKKVLILNLSQGKLGEDTTALLGAMFITKMQLTAMSRVNVPTYARPDFYLYVDEFQNFATQSFIKILSEARKYKLNLILANQYIGQVDEEIQKAIFGNVGSLVTFVVGARDAELLEREFGRKFEADDLVKLGKFEILLKMAIDGLTGDPFIARTLPLPSVVNHNRDKILKQTVERYYRA